MAIKFIQGLVETCHQLRSLEDHPEVVVRADVSSSTNKQVSIISVDGSGKEPAHARFVGEGLLTAAVCGKDGKDSIPSKDSILAAMQAVIGNEGCLLIVTNYNDERSNIDSAAKEAKLTGCPVQIVIAGKVCGNLRKGIITEKTGLAGDMLIFKIAGAAAAAGDKLVDVAERANEALNRIKTVIISISTSSDHSGPGEIDYVQMAGDKIVVVISGLGATPSKELMIVARNTNHILKTNHDLVVDRLYTGSFMTSVDKKGFSISIMKLHEPFLKLLDAPTSAPNWPVGGCHTPEEIVIPMEPSSSASRNEHPIIEEGLAPEAELLKLAIIAAANSVMTNESQLNGWDARVGDGDCGTNLSSAARAILRVVDQFPLNDAALTVREIGSAIHQSMNGTCGMIYNLMCSAVYFKLRKNNQSVPTSKKWAAALEEAIAAVQSLGTRANWRTLLDALMPASEVLQKSLEDGADPIDAFTTSADSAISGAKSTQLMEFQCWGSINSKEILTSVPDPGAMAIAEMYKAAAEAVAKAVRDAYIF